MLSIGLGRHVAIVAKAGDGHGFQHNSGRLHRRMKNDLTLVSKLLTKKIGCGVET